VIRKIVPGFTAACGVFVLVLWLSASPSVKLDPRVPGADTAHVQPTVEESAGPAYGELIKSDAVPSDVPGAWPRFRGENFDNVSTEETLLARQWDAQGPRVIWAIDVGEGHAGAAVLAGRVYILDYDRDEQADALRCLSLEDGREIWRYSYPVKVKRNHGMSRTVPAVTEKYVVGIGPKCHVTCLDSENGEFLWGLDLVTDFGATVPPWYAGQCPLIDQDRAIIAPGGDALMMAVDCQTGEIVWKTPNPHGWKMTHSSIIPMEFKGKRMYVYCAGGGVVGVSAEDGRILWETDAWKIRIANVPSPVVIGDGRIFLSGGYNAGSMMLRLKEQDGQLLAEPLFRLKPKVFDSRQHTPILHNGYIYGVRSDGELVCLDLNGNVVWSSGSTHRFGLGPYLIADGLIYVMNDNGLLTLTEATPTGYRQLAQAQVLTGHDSWGPMCIVAGRLILRDLTRMVCLGISETNKTSQ